MTFDTIVSNMQGASIALGVFMCLLGLKEFGRCLIEVLFGLHNHPTHSLCPSHAAGALVCIVGLIFAFARANTLGFIPLGDTVAGLAFVGGMVGFSLIIGLGIWSKYRNHAPQHGLATTSPLGHRNLSSIFIGILVIVMSFILVGLVKAYW